MTCSCVQQLEQEASTSFDLELSKICKPRGTPSPCGGLGEVFLTFSCFWTRSFFSASVRRSSSLRWSWKSPICRSALWVLLFSSLSLLSSMWSYMGGGGGGGSTGIAKCSSSLTLTRSS